MKKIKLVLIFLTLLPLTGCWDTNEPERMVYANGIGVDYKDGKYIVYLQIINLRLMAKAEVSSGGPEVKVEVGNGIGNTVDEAIYNLYRSSQRRIFYGHVSFLVFSEQALKHGGMKATIDFLDRYRETRYNIWLYATKESIQEILVTLPMLEMSTALSRLSDPVASFEQSSFIRPIDLRELILSLNEPGKEAILPLVTITRKNWATDKSPHNAIKSSGLAVVTLNTLKGNVPSAKAQGFRWVSKKFVRDWVRIKSKKYPTVDIVIEGKTSKIEPIIQGTNIHFTIKVKAKAVLYHTDQDINKDVLVSEVGKAIKSQIMQTYLEGLALHADVYRLSEEAYRKNVQVWKRVENNGKIPLSKNSLENIDVSVTLVHGAKQRNIPTLK